MKVRNRGKDPNRYKTIPTHPALHKLLSHQATEEDQTLIERHHVVLCYALDRMDLLMQCPDPAPAAQR